MPSPKSLSPEEINVKIHESLGNKTEPCTCANGLVSRDAKTKRHLPDYARSLDACATFEATLTPEEEAGYFLELQKMIVPSYLKHFAPCIRATAPQRCEAYLKTKNLL